MGAASSTEIVTIAEEEPPVLVAVTVYEAAAASCVGVPEIAPVSASSERPAGSAGAIAKETTEPPELVGAASAHALPLVQRSDADA